MQIHKIVFHSNGKTEIGFEEKNQEGDSIDTHNLKSFSPPMEDFKAAMNALVSAVRDLCEYPKTYAERIQVNGIALTWHKTENSSLVIKAMRPLSKNDSPFVFETPIKAVTSELDEVDTVSDEIREAVDTLCDEAVRYINGERAKQGELNFEGK